VLFIVSILSGALSSLLAKITASETGLSSGVWIRRVDHTRRIYCAAHEAAQDDELHSFPAIADLLLNHGEDFL